MTKRGRGVLDSRCLVNVEDDLQDSSVSVSSTKKRLRRVWGCHQNAARYTRKTFHQAVSEQDWELAEVYIAKADVHKLNECLCVALDSVWFLTTEEELSGATGLVEKIVLAGAQDFTRAILRTSFLASCVSACRSRTMSLADTVAVMAQRLRDRLQECHGVDEDLQSEAAAKVQKFTEWALQCIGSHTSGRCLRGQANESMLQLTAFKRFLQLAGNNLTGKDYTEAFDAACFPLTLFSSALDAGWATGNAASAMHGLLELLGEGGADNVNQCFLEAARFGSTDLVRILLQIGRKNSFELDVDLALGFASHYSKIGTMECLVNEGKAKSFLGPLMRAAERGCLEVVQWFVHRGCKVLELCLALTAATSSSKIDTVNYLLTRVPKSLLQSLRAEILKAASERSTASLQGIVYLLQADFLSSPELTYDTADCIAKGDDEGVTTELKELLQEQWSEEAFAKGRAIGSRHYVDFMRVLRRGESPLRLRELPPQLQATVAYLSLYREGSSCQGVLLPQLLRGQLVDAASRLKEDATDDAKLLSLSKDELLLLLKKRLPLFLVQK